MFTVRLITARRIHIALLLGMLLTLLVARSIAQASPTEQTTALTRVRLVTSSASGQSLGGTFSMPANFGIGTGYRAVNVQLAGWSLRYANVNGADVDHHIQKGSVRISNVQYNASTGNVSFTISGAYRDKNGDDDFTWTVYYTILALG
jgi:hypothetical protein